MSSRALAAVFRQSKSMMVRGGAGGGAPPPPFARIPHPSQQLLEETELVWNDGVAPELCIDFEAQHIGKTKALGMLLMGFGFFASLAGLVSISNPESTRMAVSFSCFSFLAIKIKYF